MNWVLIGVLWGLLATVAALVIGRGIRIADQRQRSGPRRRATDASQCSRPTMSDLAAPPVERPRTPASEHSGSRSVARLRRNRH